METSGNVVHPTLENRVHPRNSENREHSQNSQENQTVEEMEHAKVTMSVRKSHCSAGDSDSSKHSQNLLSKGEQKVDPGEPNMSLGNCDGQCSAMASEFRELSPNSRVETEGSEGTQKKQDKKPVTLVSPANIRGIRWEVLVTMYQFQVFHGLKACHKFLV